MTEEDYFYIFIGSQRLCDLFVLIGSSLLPLPMNVSSFTTTISFFHSTEVIHKLSLES